jgi:hypothetical protein
MMLARPKRFVVRVMTLMSRSSKIRRGGCGAQQPIITVDGTKMLVEFKAPNKKNDDREQLSESVELKQILSADRVFI